MHTVEVAKKRRTLLLLILFFSVIMLFDALMIFNRQEPQTYQSKAETISPAPEELNVTEIASQYKNIPEFLADADLSDDDFILVLTLLNDKINESIATAEAQTRNAIFNARSQIDQNGVKTIGMNQNDFERSKDTINTISVAMRGFNETITYFDHDSSKTNVTNTTQTKQALLTQANELIKTDLKNKSKEELNQLNVDLAKIHGELITIDRKPEIFGPIQHKRIDILTKMIEINAKERELIESQPVENKTQQPPVNDSIDSKPSDNDSPINKDKTTVEDKTTTLEKENSELKKQVDELNKSLENAKKNSKPDTFSQSAEKKQPERISSNQRICQGTNKNESNGIQTCNGVPVGDACVSNSYSGSDLSSDQNVRELANLAERIKNGNLSQSDLDRLSVLQKYTCVENEKATKRASYILCDCVAKGGKGILNKILAPARWVERHPFWTGIIITISGVVINQVRGSGGDGGSDGMPIDQNP